MWAAAMSFAWLLPVSEVNAASRWTVDASFGTGGRVTVDVGTRPFLHSGFFARSSRRSYWSLGSNNRSGDFVVGLNPDGTIQQSFRTGVGRVLDTGEAPLVGHGGSDGIGRVYRIESHSVRRASADLVPDGSYDVKLTGSHGDCRDGRVYTATTVAPDGSLYVATGNQVFPKVSKPCSDRRPTYSDTKIDRYDASGGHDVSWGTNGTADAPALASGPSAITAMTALADGTLLVAASPRLALLDHSGVPKAFGSDGVATAPETRRITRLIELPSGDINVVTEGKDGMTSSVFQISSAGTQRHGAVHIGSTSGYGFDDADLAVAPPRVGQDSSVTFVQTVRGANDQRTGAIIWMFDADLRLTRTRAVFLNEMGLDPKSTEPENGGAGVFQLEDGRLLVASTNGRGSVQMSRLMYDTVERATPPASAPKLRLNIAGVVTFDRPDSVHGYGHYTCAVPQRCPMASMRWRIQRVGVAGTPTTRWTSPAPVFPGHIALPPRQAARSEVPVPRLRPGRYRVEARLTDVYGRTVTARRAFVLRRPARLA